MIVRHRQQIGFARRQPVLCRRALALRAVPVAAGVVRDLAVRALLAARDMAAERGRAATLDRGHLPRPRPGAMPGRGRGRCPRPPAMDATRAALQAGGSVPSLSLAIMRSSGLMISRMVDR